MMKDREQSGRQASIDGFAHEHIVVGVLMKKYQNVSLVDLPLSTYDIIIVRRTEENEEDVIRAQVKTAKTSVSFTGGTRGGIDREYKSGVKEYVQATTTADVIIGICPNPEGSFDLYFVPTCLIEQLRQKSVSLNKIAALKNNYEILEKCKNAELVLKQCQEYKIWGSGVKSQEKVDKAQF